LAATALAIWLILLAGGCVADDQSTASFGPSTSGDRALPQVTGAAGELEDTQADATAVSDDEADAAAEDREAPSSTSPLEPLQALGGTLLADGFDQPVLVTSAPGTTALFVVEREGIIRIVENGEVTAEPFLDLRDRLLSNSIEQGLLGLAFHPAYESNGRFFAYWTGPDGNSVLGEFRSDAPTVADPNSLQVLFEVEQPAERHNAGTVAFDDDGLLYLSLGDGGSGGETAQDTSNPLGSIIRLDVSTPGTYSVPPGNPFDDELWIYGLRNPWRFSIDPVDRLVYIGDVGQEAVEEINVVDLDDGAGTNLGWFEMEGDECFRTGCDKSMFTDPTLQYSHAEGCSVTGGYVYRGGAIPELWGHYFFADWCIGWVRSFRYDGGAVVDQIDHTDDLSALGQVTSFGLDHAGELLAVNWDGELYRIVPVR
jgi:glucose/arabinose dehydrogenase